MWTHVRMPAAAASFAAKNKSRKKSIHASRTPTFRDLRRSILADDRWWVWRRLNVPSKIGCTSSGPFRLLRLPLPSEMAGTVGHSMAGCSASRLGIRSVMRGRARVRGRVGPRAFHCGRGHGSAGSAGRGEGEGNISLNLRCGRADVGLSRAFRGRVARMQRCGSVQGRRCEQGSRFAQGKRCVCKGGVRVKGRRCVCRGGASSAGGARPAFWSARARPGTCSASDTDLV
jgi:hypothetical protein